MSNYSKIVGLTLFCFGLFGCNSCSQEEKTVPQAESQVTEQSTPATIPPVPKSDTPPVPGAKGVLFGLKIKPTSVVIEWTPGSDQETPVEDLEYFVAYSQLTNIQTVSDLLQATKVMDWSKNKSEVLVNGLNPDRTYYFSVIVRDGDGHQMMYQVHGVKTAPEDAPTVPEDAEIKLVERGTDSLSISWPPPLTKDLLEYKVVYSLNPNIDSAGVAEAHGKVGLDWTSGISDGIITGLKAGGAYYINVLVRNHSNQVAPYSMKRIVTNDGIPPAPGASLVPSKLTESQVYLTWGAATDDGLAKLEYRLVQSKDKTLIDDGDKVLSPADGVRVLVDWEADRTAYLVQGLDAKTEYCFAVVARDSAGNLGIYEPLCQMTQ
jgi:hypothetical protein